MISVDGGGDQWQEATGDKEDDSETLEAEWAKHGSRRFGKFSKI